MVKRAILPRMRRRWLPLLLSICFLSPTLLGFDSTLTITGCSKERGVTVWGIPVRVMTKRFAPVESLKADGFVLLESGVRKALCGVVHNREPSSIGILLDRSGSMGYRFNSLALATAGINQLLDTSSLEDEYFLGYADDGPNLRRSFTRDLAMIRSGLQGGSKGKTSVVDAIYSALQSMRGAHHVNRALLVISDGYDNASTQTFGELARLISDNPIPVFVVVPVDPFSRAAGAPSVAGTEIAAQLDLSRLADGSGGYLRTVSSRKDMTSAMTALAATIRSPYVLYFEATGVGADRLREVAIRVTGMHPAPILLYRGGRRYTQ